MLVILEKSDILRLKSFVKGEGPMDRVKRSQIQNFMIYSCDVIGITIGYFLMTYLRFRMGVGCDWIHNHLIYNRWLMALLMLIV